MSTVPHDPVAEELAVRDLVHRYADAVSRQDVDAVAGLFAPDGEWVVAGYGTHCGRDEIVRFLDGLLDRWDAIVHGLLSGRVHLDPASADRARGRWYIAEFGRHRDGTEVLFSGVYHDDYHRLGGRWHFARRRYDSLFRRVGDDVATSPFPEDVATF